MEKLNYDAVAVGDVLPAATEGPITNMQLVKWAAGSGDFNSIHYDLNVAKKQGLENVLVQGPLKAALVNKLLMQMCGQTGHIRRVKSTYTGMDIAGNSLTCTVTVTGKYEEAGARCVTCTYVMANQEGKVTVKGDAVLEL